MGTSRQAPGPHDDEQSRSKSTDRAGKRRLVVFVLTFLGILALGAVLYPYFSIALAEELRGFMAVTAGVCGAILGVCFGDVQVTARYLTLHGFSVEIIEECTGVFEMLIFLAALLSYPASWRSRGIGIALGLPSLYLFNIARIVFLAIVGAYFHSVFDFMHLYFWQATLILMITTVWVLWILLVVSREKKPAAFLS
jgi:archaeosortase B (VPXXXP-CTERM-specific)